MGQLMVPPRHRASFETGDLNRAMSEISTGFMRLRSIFRLPLTYSRKRHVRPNLVS
jgi:hypothetical protein